MGKFCIIFNKINLHLLYSILNISGRDISLTCEAGASLIEVIGEGAVEVVELAVLRGHPRGKLACLVVVAN